MTRNPTKGCHEKQVAIHSALALPNRISQTATKRAEERAATLWNHEAKDSPLISHILSTISYLMLTLCVLPLWLDVYGLRLVFGSGHKIKHIGRKICVDTKAMSK